jgi:arylsulfatase A-like enzyme
MDNINEKKNVIIILIDALRTKNFSLFGYEKETDNNLKRIANENILFTNHFSSSNSTAPALTSLFTGLYPDNHGIIHQLPYTKQTEIDKVQDVKFWLPEFLKNNGYETIAIDWIGMWFKKGFDYYGEGEKQETEAPAPFRPANKITDLALLKLRQTKKPFFLFMHFWDTHFPFPHTTYKGQGTKENIEATLNSIESESQKEFLRKRIEGKELYTIEQMKHKYDLSIQDVDSQIGKIYDFLKQENLWEDTIFIVLGDHGTNLTEHGLYFSSSGLYEDSIHVPSIIHIPGIESKKISEFVQEIDIAPTILDYLNLQTQEKFDGKNLLPLIKYSQQIRDKVFVTDGLCEDIKCVRTKNRKLIIAKDSFCNLCKSSHHKDIEEYDLINDPEEKINIYQGDSELKEELEKDL